jgi:mediator of RNA polymerase II transcription subunit 28
LLFRKIEDIYRMNSNGNSNDQMPSNPVEKFEESFQNCLTAVTKEDTLTNVDKDEIRVDVEQCLQNFIEQARAMEGYFLKKRLHIASQKPELLIKDDVSELRFEVMRKEELVKKNYEKIAYWQSILADLQSSTTVSGKAGPGSSGGGTPSVSAPSTPLGRSPAPGSAGRPLTPSTVGPGPGSGRMQGSNLGFPSPIAQQGLTSGLQGPLAFLEKTASGIGMNENRP